MDKKSLLMLKGKIKSKAEEIPELEMDYFKHLNTRYKGESLNQEESREAVNKGKEYRWHFKEKQKIRKEIDDNNELGNSLNISKREFKNKYRAADNDQDKERFKRNILQLQKDINELSERNAYLHDQIELINEAQERLTDEFTVLTRDNPKTRKAVNKVVRTDMKPDMRKKKNKNRTEI